MKTATSVPFVSSNRKMETANFCLFAANGNMESAIAVSANVPIYSTYGKTIL
jgi:hypothetical protein